MTDDSGRPAPPAGTRPREWGPVHWDTTGSPLGTLLVAVTDSGVLRIGLPAEDHDAILAGLARASGSPPERSAAHLRETTGELREYFAGTRRRFDVPVDLRLSSPFRERVQRAMLTIGYGRTVSYGRLARMAGAPAGAARAVGGACAHNPVPLVVPCHRVLPAGGGVGNYRGGAAMKTYLLDLEERHGH
ncbi:methylated-DNA--[protein]-cysteine S-methyltransferase [Propionibacterium australiense]|uniref:methylated-DNA--[protein]-cysteine S-methyltransferase n=1 Tax=Propionibacterium australiense TaxID=119981 RepID=A0A383S936_9ACTN|nr:methylated-DNA--[protein]-cysteine S-methyltransferase [Propionibacterium australiense]RLP06289.1 methylated-DNA--[protein]-cysteine S-methyltransferase [Propionibacterium australiense]RLP08338.1 methylated-DNA--[protein]-cysteine S-methyltransferase [Propionibacterium australiense]SYZ34498.1 methylated-DNA-[protein]-cysteine S-methyltransferase [Propionibacterium australiense]VEH88996.1 Methylated-DNA--protein-cysteine methyltransferase, constitutive [Propionibacterium australiense]